MLDTRFAPPLASRAMSTPEDQDPAPVSGGEPDVAPLGRSGPKPPHEQTADEDRDPVVDWDAIAATPEFKALLKAKAKFIVPMTVFFCVFYFALPIAVGFFPEAMMKEVGPVNMAYAFALSQFVVAWLVAWAYTRAASKWDKAADGIIERAAGKHIR